MTTKRKPIWRPARRKISPEAVDAFRRMQRAISDKVRQQHYNRLHDLLGARPWEWPCIEDPNEPCPYEPGTEAARHWKQERDRKPEAFALFAALLEAAK